MFKRITISSDLCIEALQEAILKYRELPRNYNKIVPNYLTITDEDKKELGLIYSKTKEFNHFVLNIVEYLPKYAWFVSGEFGVIYSEGD